MALSPQRRCPFGPASPLPGTHPCPQLAARLACAPQLCALPVPPALPSLASPATAVPALALHINCLPLNSFCSVCMRGCQPWPGGLLRSSPRAHSGVSRSPQLREHSPRVLAPRTCARGPGAGDRGRMRCCRGDWLSTWFSEHDVDAGVVSVLKRLFGTHYILTNYTRGTPRLRRRFHVQGWRVEQCPPLGFRSAPGGVFHRRLPPPAVGRG